MSEIKFYSEYDGAAGMELKKIVEKIIEDDIASKWNITDMLDYHNILKYIKIREFSEYIVNETDIDIENYEREIKKKSGIFTGLHKNDFLKLYNEVDFNHIDDFFEVIENYKLYQYIETSDFKRFIEEQDIYIYLILKFRKLTEHYDQEVKDVLLSDPENAELILLKHEKERNLYLPPSLTENEKMNLIDGYVNSYLVNINVLRKIINFPTNTGLGIPDKIKLNAKRKAEKEEEKIFNEGIGIESSVTISYPENQSEELLSDINNRTAEVKVSKNWIKNNLDYPTLWNNFIYLFGFFDNQMRMEFDSKRSDSGTFELAFKEQAEHLYPKSLAFNAKEMFANSVIYSYSDVLNTFGIRIETMIEWFFNTYIKEEFKINNFIVRLPSETATYFEKSRTILPEIDRIFKQYNAYVEDGIIDQDLIQMSSSSLKFKDIKSINSGKYFYSSSTWCNTASFLLFSDQSSIFYLPSRERKYENFFKLMISEKLTKNDFQDYQLKKMQWLFDNKLIHENENYHLERA